MSTRSKVRSKPFGNYLIYVPLYRVFSRDVTAAMLVSLNKGTAAMLVSPINPPGIEIYSYANVFFWFSWKHAQ